MYITNLVNSHRILFARSIGCIFLVLALIFNEFLLVRVFSTDGEIASLYLWVIRGLDGFLLALAALHIFVPKLRLLFRLDLGIGSAVITLVLVECGLRLTEHNDVELELNEWYLRSPHPVRHHVMLPNVTTRIRWGNEVYQICTNDLGYRDSIIRKVASRAAGRRILVLGDSFVECIGVEYEDGFVSQLEEMFREEDQDVEILNAGVVSYSPSLAYRTLEEFFNKGYQADIVLLFLDISDVADEGQNNRKTDGLNLTGAEMAEVEDDRQQRKSELTRKLEEDRQFRVIWPRILEMITRASKGVGVIRGAEENQFTHLRGEARHYWTEMDADSEDLFWVGVGIEKCKNGILEIANLCADQGTTFSFAIYPYPVQLSGDKKGQEYRRTFSEFAGENSITMLDFFPEFLQRESWGDYFIEGDIHWNARGHELIAETLFQRRQEWFLVQPPPA